MHEQNFLSTEFERNRPRLKAVAQRILGSTAEAEDAVQEAWLRLSRSNVGEIGDLGSWLTTVVARLCLDALRRRRSRREEPFDAPEGEAPHQDIAEEGQGTNPEREIVLADSVGLAMLVVLDTLAPAERIAFVLHDMFAVPFEDIAPIVEKSEAATRQLASRARRRVQGVEASNIAGRERHTQVVSAFLAAARNNDFEALMKVLDPGVVFRSDVFAARIGGQAELRGATAVANAFQGRAQAAAPAFIDGRAGFTVTLGGAVRIVVLVTITDGQIAFVDAIGDPDRIAAMQIKATAE